MTDRIHIDMVSKLTSTTSKQQLVNYTYRWYQCCTYS